MVTGSHGLRKKGKARLTLLFYSACHTSSLSGPESGGQRSHSKRGGHPHLVLAPLCRMERGQRGWLFWKMVYAQSACVEDQARLRRSAVHGPCLQGANRLAKKAVEQAFRGNFMLGQNAFSPHCPSRDLHDVPLPLLVNLTSTTCPYPTPLAAASLALE